MEDPVSELHTYCQRERLARPVYTFNEHNSPSMAPRFSAKVSIGDVLYPIGPWESTKKQAKQACANTTLGCIKRNKGVPCTSTVLGIIPKVVSLREDNASPVRLSKLHLAYRCTIMIDVDNFPLFMDKIDSRLVDLSKMNIYAFSTKPRNNLPTGVHFFHVGGDGGDKQSLPTTGKTTHAYMSVFLGSLLHQQSLLNSGEKESEHTINRYIIVAGDKLARELIRVVKDDSFDWAASCDAVHCKNAQDLVFLIYV